MRIIPVFFITGYLDSGKTTFIKDTIRTAYFEGNTLILACEEGEVEYDEEILKKYNAYVEYFHSFSEFTKDNIKNAVEKYKPKQVLIEMNGMWDLTKVELPREITLVQVINLIDGETFPVYFNNMRQQMVETIKRSNVVLFTKVKDREKELEPYKNVLKVTNSYCQYLILFKDMRSIKAFEDPLPYDINAKELVIKDDDFAIFYIDLFDHNDRYDGKIVQFDAEVLLSNNIPDRYVVCGRFVMNCCVNDIQLFAFLIDGYKGPKFKNKSWINIKARLSFRYIEETKDTEAILEPVEIKEIEKKKEEVISLAQQR